MRSRSKGISNILLIIQLVLLRDMAECNCYETRLCSQAASFRIEVRGGGLARYLARGILFPDEESYQAGIDRFHGAEQVVGARTARVAAPNRLNSRAIDINHAADCVPQGLPVLLHCDDVVANNRFDCRIFGHGIALAQILQSVCAPQTFPGTVQNLIDIEPATAEIEIGRAACRERV